MFAHDCSASSLAALEPSFIVDYQFARIKGVKSVRPVTVRGASGAPLVKELESLSTLSEEWRSIT